MPITTTEWEQSIALSDGETLTVTADFGVVYIQHDDGDGIQTFEVPGEAREWLGNALLAVRP